MRAAYRLVTFAALLATFAPAQDVAFGVEHAAPWAQALVDEPAAAIARLSTGGERALPLLRALLAERNAKVRRGVAGVCRHLGPAAQPLAPRLAALLYEVDDAIADELANALLAIGDRSPATHKALLAAVLDGESHDRPTACGRALLSLDAHATDKVLRAIDRDTADRVARDGQAAQALGALDDRAIPQLLAALDEQSGFAAAARTAARDSLVRRGWRAVAPLERAGHAELAVAALCTGAVLDVQGMKSHTLEVDPAQHPRTLDRLPDARWESAEQPRPDLVLCRAADRGRGYRVARLRLRLDPAGERPPEIVADEAVLPRTLAFAAMRQVMNIPTLRPRPRPRTGPWLCVDQSHVAVRLTLGAELLLADSFTAARTSGNFDQRFCLEATRNVLDDLLRDAEWQPRDLDDDDRAQLRRTLARPHAPPWMQTRLHALADALGVAHD